MKTLTSTLVAVALAVPGSALAAARESGSAILDSSFAGRPVTMLALLAAMSLVPFAILMLTSFSKIAVVLSIARSAMGSQQIPPTVVLTGLAVILSIHIMAPVFEDMWQQANAPHADLNSPSGMIETVRNTVAPLRSFLEKHAHPDQRAMFVDLARQLRGEARADEVSESDLSVVIPAFLVSELKDAFQIGFLVCCQTPLT